MLTTKYQDRLETFMLMVREWRHIKMLKRGGQAFDPGGIRATAPGSLAIPCRACPLPNINLPRGWENVPPEQAYVSVLLNIVIALTSIHRWLYMLKVMMDANYQLKNRLRGSLNKEPALGVGSAYFVNNTLYSNFLSNYVDQDEVSICHWCVDETY